jgi:hypothetical protein
MTKGKTIRTGIAALTALSLSLAPAFAAQTNSKSKKPAPNPSLVASSFTPAVADPRLAAAFANRGVVGGSFRFTPSTSGDRSKKVQVAVRARATTPAAARRSAAEATPASLSSLTPTAYNLGVAIGWKSFAISGDIARLDGGLLPLDRESAEVGLSYSASQRFTGRLKVAAERSDTRELQLGPQERAYMLDVGGSYSIARNLDLTGGLRYKIQHDRLQSIAERRDSQAVYIGTAFRF